MVLEDPQRVRQLVSGVDLLETVVVSWAVALAQNGTSSRLWKELVVVITRRPSLWAWTQRCISRKHSVSGPLGTSLRMTLNTISGGGFRREFRSEPQAELFNEIGLSRQPSIRNCGFFVV